MIEKGTFIIAGDPDLRDMYVAECLEANRTELTTNTLVRVLYVIRYPIQHAIIHADNAHENPPFTPDQPCKLKFVRLANAHDIGMARKVGYDASLSKALTEALASVRHRVEASQQRPGNRQMKADPEELNIL